MAWEAYFGRVWRKSEIRDQKSESVVETDARDAGFEVDAVEHWLSRNLRESARYRGAAKINVNVFGLDAPSAPQRRFDASPQCVSSLDIGERRRLRGRVVVSKRESAFQIRECSAAAHKKQPIVGGNADTPSGGGEPVRFG